MFSATEYLILLFSLVQWRESLAKKLLQNKPILRLFLSFNVLLFMFHKITSQLTISSLSTKVLKKCFTNQSCSAIKLFMGTHNPHFMLMAKRDMILMLNALKGLKIKFL